jgi:hypothetical protein
VVAAAAHLGQHLLGVAVSDVPVVGPRADQRLQRRVHPADGRQAPGRTGSAGTGAVGRGVADSRAARDGRGRTRPGILVGGAAAPPRSLGLPRGVLLRLRLQPGDGRCRRGWRSARGGLGDHRARAQQPAPADAVGDRGPGPRDRPRQRRPARGGGRAQCRPARSPFRAALRAGRGRPAARCRDRTGLPGAAAPRRLPGSPRGRDPPPTSGTGSTLRLRGGSSARSSSCPRSS